MRAFGTIALVMAFSASNAMAASVSPLPPGKPAGVRQAQDTGNTLLILAGLGIVGAAIALAASSGGNNNIPSTSTSVSTSSTNP